MPRSSSIAIPNRRDTNAGKTDSGTPPHLAPAIVRATASSIELQISPSSAVTPLFQFDLLRQSVDLTVDLKPSHPSCLEACPLPPDAGRVLTPRR
jgi:hypothetical protein